MPTFVIERNIPNAGKLSKDELRQISQKSCDVVAGLNKPYKWLHSYVVDDKLYCVHEAESEAVIREHAEKGGFPADKVSEVRSVIGPETAA
jgi:hypothetical protein